VFEAPPKVPNGFKELIDTFGDPSPYLREDGTVSPKWEARILVTVPTPFQIPYYLGLPDRPWLQVHAIRCHRLLAGELQGALLEVMEEGLEGAIKNFAGCYAWRKQRHSSKRSTHAWGIALDFNSIIDPQGDEKLDTDPRFIELMERRGWVWGGHFPTPDFMHWQWCLGY
jgi:hypothetical protein